MFYSPTARAWRWDIARIRAKGYTDNVVDLMAEKLQRLSGATREALQQLACLGNVAGIATLTLVRGEAEAATQARSGSPIAANNSASSPRPALGVVSSRSP